MPHMVLQNAECFTIPAAAEQVCKILSNFCTNFDMNDRYSPEVNVLQAILCTPDVLYANPMVDFKRRTENGDFNELNPDEDPDNLPPNREPMTDEEFAEAKQLAIQIGEYWQWKPAATMAELMRNAMRMVCVETANTAAENTQTTASAEAYDFIGPND